MLVRDQVILYSEAGAVPAESLEALLDRTLAIDMKQVHDEIAMVPSKAVQSEAIHSELAQADTENAETANG